MAVHTNTGRKTRQPTHREWEHFIQSHGFGWSVLHGTGKTSMLVFVDPGAKINSPSQVVLEKGLLSDIRAKCRQWPAITNGHFSRTAPKRIRPKVQWTIWKKEKDFIRPDMWPSNSSDLNPVDYAVSGALQPSMDCTLN